MKFIDLPRDIRASIYSLGAVMADGPYEIFSPCGCYVREGWVQQLCPVHDAMFQDALI